VSRSHRLRSHRLSGLKARYGPKVRTVGGSGYDRAVRRLLLASSLLAVLAAWAATAPATATAQRVTATPNPVAFGKTLHIKGRGWPVIEFCSRTVRLSLRSDQNAFAIGRDRVGRRGRFRFTWIPRRDEVGRGDWTLVARMRCESGQDGSPNPVRATTRIRIGASNLVVGRGRTATTRWRLHVRRERAGDFCVGLGLRPLGETPPHSGEGCGMSLDGRPVTFEVIASRRLGTFAYGMARRDVGRVEVTFGGAAPMEARILPGQPILGFHGRFWIAPFDGRCTAVAAQAFDGEGRPLGEAGGRGGDCPAAP
jgi:hypothetical protein